MIPGIVASVKRATVPVAGHRYWRLFITATRTVDDIFAAIAEIELRESSSGPNVVAGLAGITASTSYSGYGPERTVDGDISTVWSCANSTGSPQWIDFDLGSNTADINFLRMTSGTGPLQANRAPQSFKVQWSDDLVTWNDQITVTDTPAWGVSEARNFSNIAEVWVRFNATGAEEAYAVPAGYTQAEAYLIGAAGGGGIYTVNSGNSGAGGYTKATFPVTAGESLTIRVGTGGKAGERMNSAALSGGLGGFPGGGSGSFGDTFGGGGGGYSGIFRGTTPVLIAGGGGGGSGYSNYGGSGGGLNGGQGGAPGGTQTGGGGGTYPGTRYRGGNANGGNRTVSTSNDGGGGGSGYWGGSANNGDGISGGGGSGYISSAATGNTYTGTGNTRPAEIPATINGESTAGLGVGIVSISTADNRNNDSGNNGAIWIKFTA